MDLENSTYYNVVCDTIPSVAKVLWDKMYDYIPQLTEVELEELDETLQMDSITNDDSKIKTFINCDVKTINIDENYLNNIETKEINNIITNNNNRIFTDVSFIKSIMHILYEPSHIIDNIYLGNAMNAASQLTLKKYNINVIFNITKEISNYYSNNENYKYFQYKLYDNNEESILEYLEKTYDDIIEYQKNKNSNILVHCYMGRSRSASVVIYYVMRTLRHSDGSYYTPDEAIDYVKDKRPIINPTFKFKNDLILAYNKLVKNKN